MIVFLQKGWVEYAVIIKRGRGDEGFQVQIEAKVSNTSHQMHEGTPSGANYTI